MIPEQTFTAVPPEGLVEAARGMLARKLRLVQICATRTAGFEITYSFSGPGCFEHLRVTVPDASVEVPNITPVFDCAFAYENEMHDLFGLKITGINIDYKGSFYRTTIPAPFATTPVCAPVAPPGAKA